MISGEFLASFDPLHCLCVLLPSGEGSYGHMQMAPLVAPEKISFGINTRCSSYTTVKEIKDSYGEVDGRLVAKEVGPLFIYYTEKLEMSRSSERRILIRHGCLTRLPSLSMRDTFYPSTSLKKILNVEGLQTRNVELNLSPCSLYLILKCKTPLFKQFCSPSFLLQEADDRE